MIEVDCFLNGREVQARANAPNSTKKGQSATFAGELFRDQDLGLV